jgi:hypothetical protein
MSIMFTLRALAVAFAVALALLAASAQRTLVAQEPGLDGGVPLQAPDVAMVPLSEAKPLPAFSRSAAPNLTTGLARIAAFTAERGLRRGLDGVALSELPAPVQGAVEAGTLKLDDEGDLQVYVVTSGDITSVSNELQSRGIVIENTSDELGIIQARVSSTRLLEIASIPGVKIVREPDYGVTNSGSVLTQGDAILGGPALRSNFGVDGTGVRVGVISDGVAGVFDAQASGDLPFVDFTTCDVIEDPNDLPEAAASGAEGTAMLEIVHDIAPGAELYFGYWGIRTTGTSLDFMDAVDCLADHTDVVVDDITFFNNGLYNGTSAVSQNAANELADATNPIRGYYNAVGNQARNHYQEPFFSSGFTVGGSPSWLIHEFAATSTTTDATFGFPCSANPAEGFCGDTVALMPGGSFSVFLQWNDAWGASPNDYDLLVFDQTSGNLFIGSSTIQDGDDDPIESFGWSNTTGADQLVNILIGRFAGSNRTLDMFVLCNGCYVFGSQSNRHNFNTESSSVPNNGDAGGLVMSLGAINQADPGNDAIESFSSRGPTNSNAVKPDASAIDGVAVTGSGGFPSPFFGTSAAAPHAAGIAALVLSCRANLLNREAGDNPSTDRTTLRNALLNGAVDIGTAGTDNTFGRGRLSANAAAVGAACTTDSDGDSVFNPDDNCPTIANFPQTNSDNAPIVTPGAVDDVTVPLSDLLGDACDDDDDNDGIADVFEPAGCNGSGALNPLAMDSDGDRVVDGAECLLGTNPGDILSKPPLFLSLALDPDRDGLDAVMEAALGSFPNDSDSDDDGISDGLEFRGYFTSPAIANTDGDACNDDIEIASVNSDLKVNSIDLSLTAQRFGNTTVPNMDVNKDGNVTSIDLSQIAQNFQSLDC